VSHPSFADVERDIAIGDPGRSDRAFELPAVDLAEAGGAEGEVLDPRGSPVLGARVAVGIAPAFLPIGALPKGTAITDSDGRFKLHGIQAGSVTLEAYAPGIGRGRTSVSISAGRIADRIRISLTERDTEPEVAATGSLAITLGERGTGGELEIVVVHVAAASGAERAGLRPGDIVALIDGVAPASMTDARARLSGPAGSDVVLEVDRGDASLRLRVAREQVRR
jgi:membrane-associated protease RseP (regulator of RpoE activity)